MSKKHEMTEHEYQIYKKKHQYEDVEDIEQGKIKREKAIYTQYRKKVTARLYPFQHRCVDPEDMEDDEAYQEMPEEEYIADRIRRNARTHKKRLQGLRLHETEKERGANG
jgi:hypothetical protein